MKWYRKDIHRTNFLLYYLAKIPMDNQYWSRSDARMRQSSLQSTMQELSSHSASPVRLAPWAELSEVSYNAGAIMIGGRLCTCCFPWRWSVAQEQLDGWRILQRGLLKAKEGFGEPGFPDAL